MTDHKVVSRAEWQAARDELLRREKEGVPGADGLAHSLGLGGEHRGGQRGCVELLMNYYFILDRVPKGRDEGAGFQTWIRRHDEYA